MRICDCCGGTNDVRPTRYNRRPRAQWDYSCVAEGEFCKDCRVRAETALVVALEPRKKEADDEARV